MELRSYDSVKAAICGCFGSKVHIEGRSHVGGGDINNASCLNLGNGERVFIKSNSVANRGFFDAEEEGLNAIASTGAIGIPKLLCKGTDGDIAFLMMEMIDRANPVKDYWEIFGRELAMMHLADTDAFVPGGGFGFKSDNYIGATKQINKQNKSWIAFFRESRLEPQVKMAERYFDSGFLKAVIKLLDGIGKVLIEPERPSLLHGDLWSGNCMTGREGKAILIDPACYIGHAEADLAMTELFGRLPAGFYRSYNETNPLQPGYEDRRDMYNLYHMLNHLNLFGSGYLGSVKQIVRRYTSP
ncbi:MAG: fructosamine kinase family protein [Lachnospiraceae bacterium]|nr:fructosamine kinase family protein [Lachnospiraceae bacterium]